jgi:hypothetical protein
VLPTLALNNCTFSPHHVFMCSILFSQRNWNCFPILLAVCGGYCELEPMFLNLCYMKYVLQSLKNDLLYAEGHSGLCGLVGGARNGWKVFWKPLTFHFMEVLKPVTFMCLEIFLSSCRISSVHSSNSLPRNCCWYSSKFLRLVCHIIILKCKYYSVFQYVRLIYLVRK